MSKSPNRLLASVLSDVYSALTPHLKIVELKFGDVLAEAGSEIRQVYFPYSGVISLVRTRCRIDDRNSNGGPCWRLRLSARRTMDASRRTVYLDFAAIRVGKLRPS
jgi:hypothetical protein